MSGTVPRTAGRLVTLIPPQMNNPPPWTRTIQGQMILEDLNMYHDQTKMLKI